MTRLRKQPISLAISYALVAALSPADAAQYDQIDLSSQAGESLTLNGDHVTHTGKGAAISVSGERNQFVGLALGVRANAASDNDAVTGVQAVSGGQARLEHSTIIATGYFGDGANARGTGSLLTLQDSDIVASGSRGRGVLVDSGATAQLVGGTVSTSGLVGDGLSAMGAGSLLRANGTTVATTGNSAYAVRAQSGAAFELANVTALTYGRYAAVFAITGADSLINADGVTAESFYSQGVDLQDGRLYFSNGSITANADGILIRPSSQAVGGQAFVRQSRIVSQAGNGINLNASGSFADLEGVEVTTQGKYGSAIWMPGDHSRAEVRDSTLETWGAQAPAVDNRAGAFLMQGGSVITHGDSAHALYASTDIVGQQGDDPAATFDVRSVDIQTFGTGSMAAVARLPKARIALQDSRVTTHGELGHALFASGAGASIQTSATTVQTEGTSAYGLSISNNAVASLADTRLETNGAKAYALVSQATGEAVVNQLTITDSQVQAHNSGALRVAGGGLSAVLDNSSLIGGSSSADQPALALWLTDAANGVAAETVDIDSRQSRIKGDIKVDAGSLQMNLREHSRLDGAVEDGAAASRLDIDGSSQWTLRGDSAVGQLSNHGRVQFAAPSGDVFLRLKVAGDLQGDGDYHMNTNLGALRGDRLDVGGQVTGNNRILVHDSGSEPSTSGGRLTLVQSQGGKGGFVLANRGQVVDAGTYRYALERLDSGATDSRWSLVNVGQTPVVPDPSEPSPAPQPSPEPSLPGPQPPRPAPGNLSTTASAAIDSSALATLRDTWDAERNSLIQRLGEVRKDNGQAGVWLRSYGQKQLIDNGVGRSFSQHVNGLQLGVDGRASTHGGSWILGGLVGYSLSDRDFHDEGSGRLESYHLGAYATYLDDTGWYADSLLTLNRWSTRFDVQTSDGDRVSAHTRSHGAGLSVEAGKRLHLRDGWFLEPQGQISALYGGGDKYQTSNGLRVDAGEGVSTQIRAGTLLGRQWLADGQTTVQPYLKLGWSQDIATRNRIKTNDIASHPDGNGGGWYAGAGMTASVGGHQLYADFETSDSPALKRPWAFNLGYRLTW